MVVKLFAPEALLNYEQEVSFLKKIQHRTILKIIHQRTALNPVSCEPLERSHLIVLREAARGDLNDYLPRFGRMTEKMARTYFRQMVEGLSAAAKLKPAILHSNLQASSILLDDGGQLYICGWS
jgi:serine/threonine protein kinase